MSGGLTGDAARWNPAGGATDELVGVVAPLRNRNFAWYFASRFVNTFGRMMANIALAFAVLDIDDSPARARAGPRGAHRPMVVLLLWGGVISDRLPRTLVLQASNVASAVTQGSSPSW